MPRRPSFDRDDLIDRARDLFWKQGWAGTSMKDLEKALGVKPGSFYAAFGSKEALYALALERYADAGRQALVALADLHGPLEALKRHPARIAQDTNAAAKACMLAKTVLEGAGENASLATQAEAALAKAQAGFAALFAAAQAQGRIAAHHDPARLARRYQSDLMGLRVMAERSDVDAEEIAQDMAADLDDLT